MALLSLPHYWTMNNQDLCVLLFCAHWGIMPLHMISAGGKNPSRVASSRPTSTLIPARSVSLKWHEYKFAIWSYDINIPSFHFFACLNLTPGNVSQGYYFKADGLVRDELNSNHDFWPCSIQVSGERPGLADCSHAEECWHGGKRCTQGRGPAGHCECLRLSLSQSPASCSLIICFLWGHNSTLYKMN